MKRILIVVAFAALLAGCGTTPGRFDNRLTITLTGDRAFVSSLYGPIGITAELSEADTAALRELVAVREAVRAYVRSQQR